MMDENQEQEILNMEIKFEEEETKTVVESDRSKLLRENELLNKKCIIRHEGNFKMRWDLFIIFLTIWNCISIPFFVSFDVEEQIWLEVCDRLIDAIFFMDVVINFFTTYMNQKTNTEIFDYKKIAINYIFYGRFFVDVLATIPIDDFITMNGSNNTATFRLFGLLKLIRLLRLGRIITYMRFQ